MMEPIFVGQYYLERHWRAGLNQDGTSCLRVMYVFLRDAMYRNENRLGGRRSTFLVVLPLC